MLMSVIQGAAQQPPLSPCARSLNLNCNCLPWTSNEKRRIFYCLAIDAIVIVRWLPSGRLSFDTSRLWV
jgi:hypothetical protein